MAEHNHAHLADNGGNIWRQLPDGLHTTTSEGVLAPTGNPFAVAFSEDVHLFAGLSGTEDFFELFDDEDARDSFHRTDFKLMRTAAFSNKTLWVTLMERTTQRFDREEQRDVCELLGDPGRCGLIFASIEKFIVHQKHNKGGNCGIKSPLRVAVITNQCVDCGSTFADRPTAQTHVVNSSSRGTCRTDRSHTTWSLEEVQLQLLRAIIWGSANVLRTCLPF